MSHWTWEYVPDAASVVGGLTPAQINQMEGLAARIADAVAVRRIGTPFEVVEAVSNVKSYGEGPLMIWFLEDYRDDVVLVVRIQHFELSDPAGGSHRRGRCRQPGSYVAVQQVRASAAAPPQPGCAGRQGCLP
jgi:hypothetical protein